MPCGKHCHQISLYCLNKVSIRILLESLNIPHYRNPINHVLHDDISVEPTNTFPPASLVSLDDATQSAILELS